MFSEGFSCWHFLQHSIQRDSELLQVLQTRSKPQRHLLDLQLDWRQDVLVPAQSPLITQIKRRKYFGRHCVYPPTALCKQGALLRCHHRDLTAQQAVQLHGCSCRLSRNFAAFCKWRWDVRQVDRIAQSTREVSDSISPKRCQPHFHNVFVWRSSCV